MSWVYSEKVMEHFKNPRNVLADENSYDADGKGYVGNAKCGDMMLLVIKVDKVRQTIADCQWKTYGCASAIASTSVLSEMIKGMTLEKAYNLKPQDIMVELDGLPDHKVHCSVLGDQALRGAIDDFLSKNGLKTFSEQKDERMVCFCKSVTEGDIRNAVKNGMISFDDFQKTSEIATGCGACKDEAMSLFSDFIIMYQDPHHD